MKNIPTELFSSQQYDKNNFFLIAGPCVVESEEHGFGSSGKGFRYLQKPGDSLYL